MAGAKRRKTNRRSVFGIQLYLLDSGGRGRPTVREIVMWAVPPWGVEIATWRLVTHLYELLLGLRKTIGGLFLA
jgi:hypothetical protein